MCATAGRRDARGRTPLLSAAAEANVETVALLARLGAHTQAVDHLSFSALHLFAGAVADQHTPDAPALLRTLLGALGAGTTPGFGVAPHAH